MQQLDSLTAEEDEAINKLYSDTSLEEKRGWKHPGGRSLSEELRDLHEYYQVHDIFDSSIIVTSTRQISFSHEFFDMVYNKVSHSKALPIRR